MINGIARGRHGPWDCADCTERPLSPEAVMRVITAIFLKVAWFGKFCVGNFLTHMFLLDCANGLLIRP